ncbi:CZB domain-containing protein [Aquitalea magnusonii]|uniref:Chemoreceptor zinc-binding protein n=1 Tax=Aquitalea magnusonii TaxID=332411 RepID=A0A318J9X7_9NEIS|nr:CZB domain-containing protein [Aquitalea magnusonii]PXX46199.1 chemoreceptor zinc-binding protein [Aquitalea magnusonii]
MNLEDALLLHFELKLELRTAMLEGRQLDAAQIGDCCGCELGRWLQDEGRISCARYPAYQQLLENHREFHLEAARVAELINQGQFDAAREALAVGPSRYSQLSSAVGSGIAELRKRLFQQFSG